MIRISDKTKTIIVIIILAALGYGLHKAFYDDPQDEHSEIYLETFEAAYWSGSDEGKADTRNEGWAGGYLDETPWYKYRKEMKKIKEKAVDEKNQYLKQFPEEERTAQRIKKRQEGYLTPSEKIIAKGVHRVPDPFYLERSRELIKRENYNSKEEYIAALKKQAIEDGYQYGYADGRSRSK